MAIPPLPSSDEMWAYSLAKFDELFDKKRAPRPPRPPGTIVSRRAVVARLEGVLRTLRATTVGQRNTVLHWAACRVGAMVEAGDLTDARTAADVLATVGLDIGLEPGEVGATIDSGFRTCGVVA